jgi:MFS family permease
MCGLSIYWNKVLVIFARVFQGIGPAVVMPNAVAILGVTYPPGRRKEMVFAIFSSMVPIGSIGGSFMAAVLALTSWPWVFYVLVLSLAAWGCSVTLSFRRRQTDDMLRYPKVWGIRLESLTL